MDELTALEKLIKRIDVVWYRGKVDCFLPPEIPRAAHTLLRERMESWFTSATGPHELMLDLTRQAAAGELRWMVQAGVLRFSAGKWTFHDAR